MSTPERLDEPRQPGRGWLRSGWRHLIALVLLLVCGTLLWTSERGRSLTADEPLHFVRGVSYWWTDTARLSYAHPPLANALTTLPRALDGDEPASPDDPEGPTRSEQLQRLRGFEEVNPLSLSRSYFGLDFDAAKQELIGARRMMMLWTLALAASLYLWCERRWGLAAGLFALVLATTYPTLLAHGQLMTTDLPAAATTFWALIALIAWIERPGWIAVLGFCLAATAMVLVKHSGLMSVVLMSGILLVVALRGRGGFVDPRRARRTLIVLGQLVLVAVVMTGLIALAYKCDRVGLSVAEILAEPEPKNWITNRTEDKSSLLSSPIAKLPESWRLPFPYPWLQGLATVSAQNSLGHGRYFMGEVGEGWHPAYFPVLLFAKTPTGTLVLLGLGALLAWRGRRQLGVATRVLLAFALIVLASACMSRINIGVRHVLPLIPILLVLAARAADLAWRAAPELPRWLRSKLRARVLVGACLLGNAIGAAWTFPTWLGDFNLLVGGPKGGHYISVVGEDWGQDLGDFAELAHERGWKRIAYYTRFGMRRTELRSLGVEISPLRCNRPYHGKLPVVIHLDDWITQRERCFEWLGEREPDVVVNHHMLVFEPDPNAPPPPKPKAKRTKAKQAKAKQPAPSKPKAPQPTAPEPEPTKPAEAKIE